MKTVMIDLIINNHPGVLYRISGLFARRSFNMEALQVSGLSGTGRSRMRIWVAEDAKLPQILRQLEKNWDVLDISLDTGSGGIEMPEPGTAVPVPFH